MNKFKNTDDLNRLKKAETNVGSILAGVDGEDAITAEAEGTVNSALYRDECTDDPNDEFFFKKDNNNNPRIHKCQVSENNYNKLVYGKQRNHNV